MTKIDISPKLYEAATESLVSDASATSTFEKMISVAFTHSTVETFIQELKATEAQIKKEFEVGSMPGPWRSAKSVIQTAMKSSIKLIDSNGSFVGKTFLQNQIKALKADEKKEITEEDYIKKVCNQLINVPENLNKGLIHKEVHKFLMENI